MLLPVVATRFPAMSHLRLSSVLLPAALLWASAADLSAQDARNPFLRASNAPAAAAAPAPTPEDPQLQFCGLYGDGAAKLFCVYNMAKNRSAWLAVGEAGPDEITVDAFDPDNNAITVRQSGRVLTLELQSAKLAAGGARPVTPNGALNQNNRLVNTVRVNPTPADERARLEAVAEEVRRRRAQRQAGAANAAPPPNPPR